MQVPIVRVFVSSTWEDLQPEREALEKAIHRLSETKFSGMEYFGSRPEAPREESLREVGLCQVYVGVFGGRYGSGITVAEYRMARELGLPCFIYFKDEQAIERDADLTARETDDQTEALKALKAELLQHHTRSTFTNPDELAAQATADLHRWLFDEYLAPRLEQAAQGELSPEEARALLHAVRDLTGLSQQLLARLQAAGYVGAQVATSSLEAVQRHRADLRRRLEEEAQQRWGGIGTYIREEGLRLPIEASPYQPGLPGPRQDLLSRMRQADRLLVLGEPGSGKTVALQRLAWELCMEQEMVIPVIVPLLYYAAAPLRDWVRDCLRETGHLEFQDDAVLEAFLQAGEMRCFFLFDGLNEVAPDYRNRLADELVRWMKAYPRHAVVITSRSQDKQWRVLRHAVRETVVIQPITEPQMLSYLQAHLGEECGQGVFEGLDERMRGLAQRPLLLYLIKEASAAGEALPGNRAELYARFVSRMLRRDTERKLDATIREQKKGQAASCIAYDLHRRHLLACPRDEAVDILAGTFDAPQIEASEMVGVLARHGLLIGEERLRFPHQTLQEHFAAQALREQVRQERAWGSVRRWLQDIRLRWLGRAEGLAALAADEWWAEALIHLAGLVDDPAWLARGVARVNPWLAWWCVQEGRAVDEETRALIESRSIRLLKSERVQDRRRAVQTLAQMRTERCVDPLFRLAADSDVEVAGLAAQSLLQMGQAVRERALALAQQPEVDLHRAGLAYLSALLGQPMVYVPPGSFLMGSNPAVDKLAYEDEHPQHEVVLPGYWIGRYPVTVAQFRTFVQASGYEEADEKSLQGQDDHPVTSVTWHDALAYCRWLSESSGLAISLPSEAEWEKAARGTDGRIYPWGDQPPTDELCNFDMNVGETTAVGSYSPAGDSPYGCADMAGNVWEWTRSLWGKKLESAEYRYPYDPEDLRREDLSAGQDALRVLRGGSFDLGDWSLRCACRLWFYPNSLSRYYGFRVVLSPTRSGL